MRFRLLALLSLIVALLLTSSVQSADGLANITREWTKDENNPVLTPGSALGWDGGGVYAPSVLADAGVFQMWYTGQIAGSYPVTAIGLATSTDGTNWIKGSDNPVLADGLPGEWDADGAESATILKAGDTYHMWYAGRDETGRRQIGYATSSDGVNWTKHRANPVLELGPEGAWDSQGVSPGSVLWIDATYHMWYTGTNMDGTAQIGYATSSYGVNWTKHTSNPVLRTGDTGWDALGVYQPAVLFDEETYRMWYTGVGGNGTQRIGFATSSDGIRWVSDPSNPVLRPGESGAWDAASVQQPAVVFDRESASYHMWYAGQAEDVEQIGHATTSRPTATPTPTTTPTPTATNAPTSTFTPIPSPTPTKTIAPTSTATDTPPTITPTPWSDGDPYEPDNTCSTAQTIIPDGDPQQHNFHTAGDPDWLRFQATAGTDYIISALAIGDNAHPIIRLYDKCDEAPIADSSDNFGFDQIIAFRAERDGLYYLKLTHRDEKAYGNDTAYQVSVRPGTTGAAIIAGGRLYANEQLQQQITFMTERAYRVFKQAGYSDDAIYYMSADSDPPAHMDAPSLPDILRHALQNWAPNQIQDGDPLYLYLTDHGEREVFFLDTAQDKVTPEELDTWLRAFEAQRPNSPVVIIIEACQAGSFITPVGTLSRPGRVIISATGEDNLAYAKPAGEGGAYFSDAFFNALAQSYDVWASYQKGRQVVRGSVGDLQTPWLDGNGNGLPYPLDPADEGAGRHLGLGRLATLSGQAPFIEPPRLPATTDVVQTWLQVNVLDEHPAGVRVWMMVTTPSTPQPSAPPGYITPISHAERVELTYNPTTGFFETEFAFNELGLYQFVFHAEDAGGQRAQAASAHVLRTDEAPVYLPLIARQ